MNGLQEEHAKSTGIPVLQFVNRRETLRPMAQPKREQDEIARQNLVYLIEACSRRLKKPRGGRTYLAEVLGVQAPYLSVLTNRYEGRNVGRELKTKAEGAFNLPPGWMDAAHDASSVGWLLARVPSRPHRQSKDSPLPDPHGYVRQLENTVDELRRRVDALESSQGSKSSTRK